MSPSGSAKQNFDTKEKLPLNKILPAKLEPKKSGQLYLPTGQQDLPSAMHRQPDKSTVPVQTATFFSFSTLNLDTCQNLVSTGRIKLHPWNLKNPKNVISQTC